MPVNKELCLFLCSCFCKMYLRHFSGVHGLAANQETLLENAQFFEPCGVVKSDNVLVSLVFQFDFDFKSDGSVCPPASEVFWLD